LFAIAKLSIPLVCTLRFAPGNPILADGRRYRTDKAADDARRGRNEGDEQLIAQGGWALAVDAPSRAPAVASDLFIEILDFGYAICT